MQYLKAAVDYTLYITAREGLYRIRTLSKGPERLGK